MFATSIASAEKTSSLFSSAAASSGNIFCGQTTNAGGLFGNKSVTDKKEDKEKEEQKPEEKEKKTEEEKPKSLFTQAPSSLFGSASTAGNLL